MNQIMEIVDKCNYIINEYNKANKIYQETMEAMYPNSSSSKTINGVKWTPNLSLTDKTTY